ncbi:MAG: nuclear transport factor 2 family protein [Solirubrobacterales bacterium]
MALETRDYVEIQMLLGLYGHILDDRDWDALPRVFTEDIVFDAGDSGLGVMRGIAAIVERWREPFDGHPLGHYMTNVVISEDEDGTVRARSKHLGVRPGTITLMTYDDVLRRTPDGWRLAERVAKIQHRVRMFEPPA